MKLLIDLFACQTPSRFRGIGRYTHALVRQMVDTRASNEMVLLASALYPEAFEDLRSEFSRLLPQGAFLPYSHRPIEITQLDRDPFFDVSSTIVRHAYQMLSPDAIIYPSVFEGWGERGVVPFPGNGFPAALCAAIIYDFIPYRFSKTFLDPDPFFKKAYFERLNSYKNFDLLLAISESTRQDAIEILGIEPEKVVNISGAASSIFKKKTYTPDQINSLFFQYNIKKPYIFYPGNGEPHKNLEKLLKAFSALPHEIRDNLQVVFTHVGDETLFKRKLSLMGFTGEDVVVTGHISDDNLVMLYNLCHLFVFPSLYEGFGLPILEAMACGVPVIASNSSSIPEVLGRSDAMFDASREESITAALYHALTDQAFRQDLSAYGLERVKLFGWEKSAQKAWDALNNALIKKKKVFTQPVSRGRGKPRVAFVSPMPPQKSGIAHYSADLLPYLKENLDIDVFVEPGLQISSANFKNDFKVFPWTELLERRDDYATVVYQMGNSEYHAHMFKLIKNFPGVVDLHDFYLSQLVRHLIATQYPDFAKQDLTSALDKDHGLRSLIDLVQQGPEKVIWEWPLNWQVLKYAQKIIVHSPYQGQLLKRYFGGGWTPKLNVIKQPYPMLADGARDQEIDAKEVLGIGRDKFLLCSFGFINSEKLGQLIVQAFGSAFSKLDQVVLVFVGELDQGQFGKEFLQSIHDLGLEDRVKVTGFVDNETYALYLQAADVAIQLRNNSRGETSRAVLDTMAHGIATIVNAHGSLNDYSSDVVVQLPEFPDAASLSAAMSNLWADPDYRQKVGACAKNEIAVQHAPELIGSEYSRVIRQAIQEDDRLLFAPLVDSIIAHQIPMNGIHETTAFAANNRKLRCQPRILIDVTNISYIDLKTGIQRVVKNIIRELFASTDPFNHYELVRINDGELFRSLRFTEKLFNLPVDSLGLEKQIAVQPGDMLYMLDTSWNLFDQYLPVFDQIRRNGGRIFTQLYDLIPIRYPETTDVNTPIVFNKWIKTAIEQSDGFICISRSVADELGEYIEEENISLKHNLDLAFVHLGSDLKVISSKDDNIGDPVKLMLSNDTDPIFIMVSTIEPRKNHNFALDAFEQLWRDGEKFRLCIIGKIGWNVKQVEERIKNHPELGKRLFFIESATDTELNLCYDHSIALISCSLAEGYGLPIVEAAYHHIPAIVSDIPVFHEVGGEGSLFFSLDSPAELANAARSMALLTPDERLSMAQKIKILSWKESAGIILEVLQNKHVYKSLFSSNSR